MRRFHIFFAFVLLLGSINKLYATHIVGGEFELVHQQDFTYRLNLVLYFDEVNGASEILNDETVVTPFIFRKRGHVLVETVNLFREAPTSVRYSNPDCAVGDLSTLRLFFTAEITLDPSRYNDPEGYYIVWERCCRNYVINNIFSENPDISSRFAGQTFFMEFPAVVDESGNSFVNSSPVLFPPLSDYACKDRLYFADFAGDDPDGDSIVYSLVTPLNSSLGTPVPTPVSSNIHSFVNFRPGFEDSAIPGAPALGINRKGLLTVRPSQTGLFVFAVKAEEFRDGKKIGEVRRDFQMLVLDCPDPGVKPELLVKGPDGKISDQELLVTFDNTKVDSLRCVSFFITDMDGSETVEIEAVSVNFEDNLNSIFSVNTGFISSSNDTLKVEVCFEECPFLQDVPFIIDFIASDDACPLPLKDTLRLNVLIEPPVNIPPDLVVETPDGMISDTELSVTFNDMDVGNDRCVSFIVTDKDNGSELLKIEAVAINFEDSTNSIFSVDSKIINKDTLAVEVCFADCPAIQDVALLIDLIAFGEGCPNPLTDTLSLNVKIEVPDNNPPEIQFDENFINGEADLIAGDLVNVGITGIDIDGDLIFIDLINATEISRLYDLNFIAQQGIGEVKTRFEWQTDCSLLPEDLSPIQLELAFVVSDNSKCFPAKDTVMVKVNLKDRPRQIDPFMPPNVFTPNGDELNNTFRMPTLPNDNCKGEFQAIYIYNRWGRLMFKSEDRSFEWTGKGAVEGVYFYNLIYSDIEYNGHISLLR